MPEDLSEPAWHERMMDALAEGLREKATRQSADVAPQSVHLVNHLYTSTACQHSLHSRCRRTCKFCETPCRCPCHTTVKGV
jgi:hypothetical protein